MLNTNPALGIRAVERRERRLPDIGGLVTLFLVDVVGDGPQLGEVDVVGKLTPLGRGPGVGAGL
jgi:hypothetical protein